METTLKILIEKDSATRIQKEVRSLEEARAFQHNGFVVHLVNEDGTLSDLPPEVPSAVTEPPAPPAGEGDQPPEDPETDPSNGGEGDQSNDGTQGTGE